MELNDNETFSKIKQLYGRYKTSDNFFVELTRDLLFVAAVISAIMVISYLTLGVFGVPAVSVISKSMDPHMKKGDLVIYKSPDRTNIITYQEGATSGYESFENYGNVILYYKNGDTNQIPIIHRALYWVETGEPMWDGGPSAPYSGYITKGDNNSAIDQACSISERRPIKEEWIMGVSLWRIPWLGYPTMMKEEIIKLIRK
ncbi:MAG TPA: S26 family signal peptidase [Candidatus Nanoarchaeia archaeon]|nr:S26 family signal peptidase [Candidatus Nanoarchaeia archaeon]